jgi:hypothetical protein
MGTTWSFHNDRVKPYPDTEEQGLTDAKYDFNQFSIDRINYFCGNPHKRTSMQFSVDFLINSVVETSIINYTNDIAETAQFNEFIHETNYLYPLRFAASLAKSHISELNRNSIKHINCNDVLWLNLRFFDGFDRTWFDSLELPDKSKIYVVSTVVKRFSSKTKTKLIVFASTFQQEYILTPYDILSCTFTDDIFHNNRSAFIIVDKALCEQYPQLLKQ